jgi:hypothetical protein
LTPGGCPIWAAFVDMLHAVVQWFLCYFLEQERDRRGGRNLASEEKGRAFLWDLYCPCGLAHALPCDRVHTCTTLSVSK